MFILLMIFGFSFFITSLGFLLLKGGKSFYIHGIRNIILNEILKFLRNHNTHFNNFHQQSNKQNANSHQNYNNNGNMSYDEALEILGLEKGKVTRVSVVNAYNHLIKVVHPDKGGSNYLTQKINAAKQVLLQSL